MMNLIALLLVLTGTANIDATGYLHQEILIIRNYNNNNDGLKKVKDAASFNCMCCFYAVMPEPGGPGGPLAPQYLADYPHLLPLAPPMFFTFRHH